MPLKKPKSVPAVPKTRKNNPEKTKEPVSSQMGGEVEYRCAAYFSYNPVNKSQNYILEIETIKLFSVLNYNLSVTSKKTKSVIDISLLGLKATNNYVNEPGPAKTIVSFGELYGKHTINVKKQDGRINSAVYDFNIFKKSIELVDEFLPAKKNNSKFCTFTVAKEKFTFA